jgi:hypothetical protein
VTRTAPQPGPAGSKTRQCKEKNGPWPGVGTRHRDGAAREGWLRSGGVRAGEGAWGASRCSAHTREKQARQKGPKGRGVYPLPGRIRRFGHGGTRIGTQGSGKKTRFTRPAVTYERTWPVGSNGTRKAPRTSPFFPARVCTRHPAWQRPRRRGKQVGEVPGARKRS